MNHPWKLLCLFTAALLLVVGCGDDGSGDNPDTNSDAATDAAPDRIENGCFEHSECATDPAGPVCTATGACGPLPAGAAIGWGDGSPESVTLTPILPPAINTEAPDLEFHPTRDELWVVNRRPFVDGVCSDLDPGSARCGSLSGFTTVIFAPGKPEQRKQIFRDPAAFHFMRRPPALAMGVGETFATCGEARTANTETEESNFIGPTLWSTDFDIYTILGANGSHLDMLHVSPFCVGIAHERNNVYWVFNGQSGSLDRYDFHEDHGPGADDHSDGEIFRYADGQLSRVPNIPSHMVYNPDDRHLYVADTGNGRIIKLDTTTGTAGEPFSPVYEQLADWRFYNGATVSDVVPPGTLTQPSGLALHDGVLYVSDNATSKFHAFDISGNELNVLDTGLPPGTLAGIEIGPDGKLWFTMLGVGAVFRLDPEL